MRLLSAGAVLGSLCLLPCPLSGQELGDPGAGFTVAEEVCAECHAVLPGQGFFLEPSPLPFEDSVPLPFEDIANTPGITEMALLAWMTSSHPTMPDIMLEAEELRDVVAYILNLKNQ
jgi:mono/diheme cytochrome c family protein